MDANHSSLPAAGLQSREESWDSLPTLDRAVLDELRQFSDDEEDLAHELIGLFLDEFPAQLLALQSALRAHNTHEVEQRSHRPKGSAGSIGAVRLREICQHVETDARCGRVAEAALKEHVLAIELSALSETLKCMAAKR